VTIVLSDVEKRLYARQVLLNEVGMAGQARLCATEACVPAHADAAAGAVAADYLQRAGVRVSVSGLPLKAATSAEVDAIAGEPMLRDCAAWLAGAWAAVEAIKASTGAGEAAVLEDFVLNAEVG
jgi:hypothetical protein